MKDSVNYTDEEMKQIMKKELLSILICITYTKGKANIGEGTNFEDMI